MTEEIIYGGAMVGIIWTVGITCIIYRRKAEPEDWVYPVWTVTILLALTGMLAMYLIVRSS